MHPMIRRAVPALALWIGAAACAGDNPAAVPAPANPQFETGVTFGSGGRASTTESDTTTQGGVGSLGSGNDTTAVDSESTAEGGVTFGSGG